MVEEMVNAILDDLAPKRGDEAILFVNGFGGTPLIELYLLYHEAARMIEAAGLKPARSLVGSYVTSLDMAGASITLVPARRQRRETMGRAGAYAGAALGRVSARQQRRELGKRVGRTRCEPKRSPGKRESASTAASRAWSRRAQIAFVGVAMPVLVLLLVGAPYLLSHYVVNRHYRFNYIPPPLGGDRALEGHWTDAPVVPVRRVNFGADWSAFGWIAADDDLTTDILPTAPGTVSQVIRSVGQAVAKDAPLFAIRTKAAKANPTDAPSPTQEIVVAAPVAGVVTQFDVAVGQVVKTANAGTATTAASIADLSSVWLVAEIDENDARPLRPGQPVEVLPTALAGRVYKGKLSSVSPVDPDTMRASVRIARR